MKSGTRPHDCKGLEPNARESECIDAPRETEWQDAMEQLKKWSTWWVEWNESLRGRLEATLKKLEDNTDTDELAVKYHQIVIALENMGDRMQKSACMPVKILNEYMKSSMSAETSESGEVVATGSTQPPPPPFRGGGNI